MNTKSKKSYPDYLFCLLVGSVYLYAVLRAILGATFIQIEQMSLFFIVVVGIVFFMIVLYNLYTRLFAAGVVILIALYVFFTFENFVLRYPHFYEMFLMITGQMAYRSELGIMIVWILSLLLGLAVVMFVLHFFNFYLLLLGGAVTFIFTWIPGFNRDETAFLFFITAFCLILVRKTTRSYVVSLTAAPICIAVVLLANARVPAEHELFVRRYVNPVRVDAFSDFVYELFNPTHFRFQTTGFSGAGGRLGGSVTPNNRSVMSVIVPGRTYLAGATSNIYTGDRWLQALEEGDVYTHGLEPSVFEMLETAAALIRGATHVDFGSSLPLADVWLLNNLPMEDLPRLHSRMFSVVGVWSEDAWRSLYWHTYMPMDTITVTQGQNRTGTVFLPPRATALRFAETSFDYAPYVQVLPSGDMQTPDFMSRGAGYHVRFLNVDTQISFIEYILHGTNEGVYVSRTGRRPLLPSMGGRSAQLPILVMPMPNLAIRDFGTIADARHMVTVYATRVRPGRHVEPLSQTPGIEGFIELIDMYFDGSIHYVYDSQGFMRLLDTFSTEILAEYSRQVREHFMQVPDITPQRVFDITRDIVYGLDNDFARVTAIRDFLLQFPYTLSPVAVPRGVCFVDFFLFEGQEGYCTYFASAMAVMARIAGVPSRYVEGFVTPPPVALGEPVAITNRMAHAWVEVYLEGFGWKTIEATPTYALLMSPAPLPAQVMTGSSWTDADFMDRMYDIMSDWEIEQEQIFFRPYIPTTAEEIPEPESQSIIPIILVGAVFSILLIAFLAMRLRINNNKLINQPPREQVLIYFHALIDIITYYTKPLTPSETEKAYAAHMGKRFAFRSDTVFLHDIIALYYKAKYSPAEITQDEAALMKEAHEDMLLLLRSMRHRYQFFYLRHIRRLGCISGSGRNTV